MFLWPILNAVLIQALVILFCSGFRDGGIIFLASMVASVPFWLTSVAIVAWRGQTSTRLEVFFLRWGLVFFVVFGTLFLKPLIAQLL